MKWCTTEWDEIYLELLQDLYTVFTWQYTRSTKKLEATTSIGNAEDKIPKSLSTWRKFNCGEWMLKFDARHDCKLFLKGKPIWSGCKSWCFNTRHDYFWLPDTLISRNRWRKHLENMQLFSQKFLTYSQNSITISTLHYISIIFFSHRPKLSKFISRKVLMGNWNNSWIPFT